MMKTIRASEVAEYSYCARSWWLRRVGGLEPEGAERRAAGTALHVRHGRLVRLSGSLFWLALLVLGLGIAALLLSGLAG